MIDVQKTIDLIKGGLLEPRITWQSYLTENRGWQDTAFLLTLPLLIISFVLSGVLALLFGGHGLLGESWGFGGWLLGLIMAVIGIAVAAFIFSYLGGLFKGRHDFGRGLAAVSLAAIPAYLGSIVGPVPFIGWIVSLALGIVTLVFLYQIVPSYLEVPEEKRVLHYIASLVSCFVVMMILGAVLGVGGAASMSTEVSTTGEPAQSGMFGSVERYGRLIERAEQDRYDPPADGRITEAQMSRYLEVMRKTAGIRNEQMANIEQIKEQYKDQEPDVADLPAIAGGIGAMLGAFNAEMEVVVTGDGNWAEHQWIKEQLRVARVQKDINDAVKHNYALYQAHRSELEQLSAAY